MANDNDVVRLKHLNSLASVVHDITLHSGGSSQALPDSADFALYVPNDTSIIITGKQAPVLSLGSWSSADTVYSAPITYTGDGTLSTDIGTIANDILTVADADGNFNGVISASSGNDFAATKTNFSYNSTEVIIPPKPLPSLVLGSWSAVDSVYSAPISYSGDGALSVNIGSISNGSLTIEDSDGNFSGVISAAEGDNFNQTDLAFNYNTDTITTTVTVQSGEDRLQKMLNGCPDYELAGSSSITLHYGDIELTLTETYDSYGTYYRAIDNNNNIDIKLVTKESSVDHYDVELIKLNENGFCYYVSEKLKNGSYCYDGKKWISAKRILCNDSDYSITGSQNYTISTAVSSVAASMQSNNAALCRSIFNGDDILVFSEKKGINYTYQNGLHFIAPSNTQQYYLKQAYVVGGNSSDIPGNGQYEIKTAWNAEYTFENDKVIVSKGDNSRLTPILTSSDKTGVSYINLGNTGGMGVSTVSSPTVQSIFGLVMNNYENPFLNQEGETGEKILLGVWPDKTNSSCYFVTFKEGTYDAETWLDDCFTVWGLCKLKFTNNEYWKTKKTNLKITDIVDKISL